MTILKSMGTLNNEIGMLPDCEAKQLLTAYLLMEPKGDSRGSFVHVVFRGNVQNLLDLRNNMNHNMWGVLREFLMNETGAG